MEDLPVSDGAASTSDQHRASAQARGPLRVAVITASDSRTEASDRSGGYLREAVAGAGHTLESTALVPDDPDALEMAIRDGLRAQADCILVTGGTGLARRDISPEVVDRVCERTVPGFGELFRVLSYEEIGAAAMLSRACAGLVGQTLLVSLPGSPAAVRLAWEKLLAPELAHLVYEANR